jgi:hypothetical protein
LLTFLEVFTAQFSRGSGSNNDTENVDPYFVRRWGPEVNPIYI